MQEEGGVQYWHPPEHSMGPSMKAKAITRPRKPRPRGRSGRMGGAVMGGTNGRKKCPQVRVGPCVLRRI
jgi:hypothetical protein